MAEITLPPFPRRGWRGIILERHSVGGAQVVAVTESTGFGRSPRRRWFPERAHALAYAAETSDRHGLLIFDLTDRGEDQ